MRLAQRTVWMRRVRKHRRDDGRPLPVIAQAVAGHLVSIAGDDSIAIVRQDTLADDLGVGVRHLRKAIDELRAAGLIARARYRRGRTSGYLLLDEQQDRERMEARLCPPAKREDTGHREPVTSGHRPPVAGHTGHTGPVTPATNGRSTLPVSQFNYLSVPRASAPAPLTPAERETARLRVLSDLERARERLAPQPTVDRDQPTHPTRAPDL